MSNLILEKLEQNIDTAIENVELMRLQVEDLEQENAALESENMVLRGKLNTWEQTLTQMLYKLGSVNGNETPMQTAHTTAKETETELEPA